MSMSQVTAVTEDPDLRIPQRVRRGDLSEKQNKQIAVLYWGNLGPHDNVPKRSKKEISKILGIKECTIRHSLDRYKKNGNRVVKGEGLNHGGNKILRVLSGAFADALVSQETLKWMAPMSMEARCMWITEVLREDPDPRNHIRVHRGQLAKFYKSRGITR